MAASVAPAPASTLTLVGRSAVGAGALGLVCYRRAAVLVSAAVAARCIEASCLHGIGTFLSDHPHLGPASSTTSSVPIPGGIPTRQGSSRRCRPPRVLSAETDWGRATGPMSKVEVDPPDDCRAKNQESL